MVPLGDGDGEASLVRLNSRNAVLHLRSTTNKRQGVKRHGSNGPDMTGFEG